MSSNDALYSAAKMVPESIRMARTMDWILVVLAIFLIAGTFHIHFMLFAGDWDFWIDWKDRQWWPVVTPIVAITFPAAVSYILWANFRLAFGATLCLLVLLLATWLVRFLGWHWWSHYPINVVVPAQMVSGALILDTILLISRSWMITAMFGGGLFGLLFYVGNWAVYGPTHLAVEMDGQLLSLADYIGFGYIRTGTPEYLKMIEKGSLRTFGGHTTAIASAFAGFICILMYAIWWYMGKFFCSAFFMTKNKRGATVKFTENPYIDPDAPSNAVKQSV